MPKYVVTGAILRNDIFYEVGSTIELDENEAALLPVGDMLKSVQSAEPLPPEPVEKPAPKPAPVAKKPASKKAAGKKRK